MTRKVAMIGSHAVALNTVSGAQIVDVLKSYGEDVLILTRGMAGFEQFVAAAALALGQRCFTYAAHGGRDNMDAYDELVRDADEVVAIMDPDRLNSAGRTGAGMVVERALAAGKPVRAGTIVNDQLVWADQ